jgi:hypothetical protein
MTNDRSEKLAAIGVVFNDENFVGHGVHFKQSLCHPHAAPTERNFWPIKALRWSPCRKLTRAVTQNCKNQGAAENMLHFGKFERLFSQQL